MFSLGWVIDLFHRVALSVTVGSVAMSVAVVLGEEEVLIEAVSGEEDGGSSQAGEQALEAVPSSEGAGVSPSLAAEGGQSDTELNNTQSRNQLIHVLPSPWVLLCPD